MNKLSSNTAILFFSRSAEAEGQNKRFLQEQNIPQNTRVAELLISHTYSEIQKTDLPCFHIDEQQQIGNSFGERLTNAFRQIFKKGYNYVISVGNDTPELKAEHIREAARQLGSAKADIVLGPDIDGGTWLMGYKRDAFKESRFRHLPWNTAHLLDTILEQHDGNEIHLLEELGDIDFAKELKAFLDRPTPNIRLRDLLRQLKSIIASAGHYFTLEVPFPIWSPTYPCNRLRAPPAR